MDNPKLFYFDTHVASQTIYGSVMIILLGIVSTVPSPLACHIPQWQVTKQEGNNKIDITEIRYKTWPFKPSINSLTYEKYEE
jgi:hypothetical protein